MRPHLAEHTRSPRRQARWRRPRGPHAEDAHPRNPASARSALADRPSGMFEMKTATSTATLMPSPATSDRPSTIDSGCRRGPRRGRARGRSSAGRASTPCPRRRSAREGIDADAEVEDDRSPARTRSPRRCPLTERSIGLLEQLVGDRADERPRAERKDEALRPLRDLKANARTAPTAAPTPRGRPRTGLDHRIPRSCRNCQVMSWPPSILSRRWGVRATASPAAIRPSRRWRDASARSPGSRSATSGCRAR